MLNWLLKMFDFINRQKFNNQFNIGISVFPKVSQISFEIIDYSMALSEYQFIAITDEILDWTH